MYDNFDDDTKNFWGGFGGCLVTFLILLIPVVGPIIVITGALILVIYHFIKSISQNIKTRNRNLERSIQDKRRQKEASKHNRSVKSDLSENSYHKASKTNKKNNLAKPNRANKNSKKVNSYPGLMITCNQCGALFKENSYICEYCGSELKLKNTKSTFFENKQNILERSNLGELIPDLNEEEFKIKPLQGGSRLEIFINNLPEIEQKVFHLRFGLGGNELHTLSEIGKILGINREKVRKIELSAITKLKKANIPIR